MRKFNAAHVTWHNARTQKPTAGWGLERGNQMRPVNVRKNGPAGFAGRRLLVGRDAAEAGTCLRVAFTSHTASGPLVLACRLMRPWACPAPRLVPFSSLSDRAAMLPVSCCSRWWP